jgi:hypothetical protein
MSVALTTASCGILKYAKMVIAKQAIPAIKKKIGLLRCDFTSLTNGKISLFPQPLHRPPFKASLVRFHLPQLQMIVLGSAISIPTKHLALRIGVRRS